MNKEYIEIDRTKEELEELFGICYQIAGSILTNDMSDEGLLLLNTLSRYYGPGASLLLENDGAFEDVMKDAIKVEE